MCQLEVLAIFSRSGLAFIRVGRVAPGGFAEVKTKITARIVILMSDRKLRGFGKLLSRCAVLSGHVSIAGVMSLWHRRPLGGGVIGLGHVEPAQCHNQCCQENLQNCHIMLIAITLC